MNKIFILAILILTINGCSIEDSIGHSEKTTIDISQQMKKIRSSADRLFYYTWNIENELTESEKADLTEIVGKLKNNFHSIKAADSSETKETGFQLILADQNELLEDIENNLRNKNFDYARWQLKGVTHNCFACHSRLPSLNDKIDKNLRIDNTTFESKLAEVEFLVASRQFKNAENQLYHLAKQLSSTDYRKGLALDSIKLWLLLQIRVSEDLDGAAKNLEKLANESSFDSDSKNLVSHWANQLKERFKYNKSKLLTKSSREGLKNIESILGNLVKHRTEDENNRTLVSTIYASSMLHQLQFDNKSTDDNQKILGLLGISYSRMTIPSLQTLSAPYLVRCIKNSPRTKWSKICFDTWKSNFDFNHTGSSGKNIEKSETDKIEELRRLSY